MSSKTQPLATRIKVRQHYLRSANLEHHKGQMVDGYIPTGRALEVLHRVGRAMASKDAGRAWSLTGPYGAGKSSFGLFVHALFGPDGDTARLGAEAAVAAVDPELLERLNVGRQAFKTPPRGFIRAAATAQREPISNTVLRALNAGAYGYWHTRMPTAVKSALAQAGVDRTPRALGIALETLCEHAPVLIEIDEFGKNLEHLASQNAEADLFVLQELAERCTGEQGLPAVLITLQHLAFDDYVHGANTVQRREWGKVQGRFEDIPFVESAEQSLRLVAGAFEPATEDAGFSRTQRTWATAEARSCERLGLSRLLPGGADTLGSCYPLHPMTLLALPEMCARFGQHGRTLFSFLTGREPFSVADFLDAEPIASPLPTVGLDRLYDFFITNAAGSDGRHVARLTEIDTTLRETTGLTEDQRRVLKVIGVLNVLSQGGPMRASIPVIRYALSSTGPITDRKVQNLISELQKRGVLTYRAFADEYRLWQGSDLDLATLVEQAREELSQVSAAELLAGQHNMRAVIAGKHSQRVGMLRYFDTVLADAQSGIITGPSDNDASDGLLIYFIGAPEATKDLIIEHGEKPVLIATTTAYAIIVEAIFELAAVLRTLDRVDVQADRVARRELQDRAADARRRLLDRVSAHLHPAATGVEYRLADISTVLPVGRGLSSLLSQVCDDVYRSSPEIHNEMLGRRDLTSQAARARRELLTAMVENQEEEWLGFTGFGPEKAMYAALLRHTGIHRDTGDGRFGYHQPKKGSIGNTWGTMTMMLDRASSERLTLDKVYAELMAPPIGLKEGPIPVLLTALLLNRVDDVAIYQEGTYQPTITADLLERLVKSPDRFAVKYFKMTPHRTQVLETVAQAVESISGRPRATSRRAAGSRNGTLLGVTGPLLTTVRDLPYYTLRTTALSARARAVRDAILNAREPDELIFVELPAACGVQIPTGKQQASAEDLKTLKTRLEEALRELNGAYDALLEGCKRGLAAEFALSKHELPELRAGLKHHADPLGATLLEPRLRSFVLLAADENLDDEAWLEAIANNIAGRPAPGWRDEDAQRFDVELRVIGGAFHRYQALHFETIAKDSVEGFEPHRVTITSPGGNEYNDVVWVDQTTKPRLQEAVDNAIAAAEILLGSRGGQALMALLAGTVTGARHDQSMAIETTASQRKVHHA
jgi:hypothetical protein